MGQANYATAKAGVVGLTKAIAKEWGPFNIRCNCLTYGCGLGAARPRQGRVMCLWHAAELHVEGAAALGCVRSQRSVPNPRSVSSQVHQHPAGAEQGGWRLH